MGKKTKLTYLKERNRVGFAPAQTNVLAEPQQSSLTAANISTAPENLNYNHRSEDDVLAEPGVVHCVDFNDDKGGSHGKELPLPGESRMPEQPDVSFHLSDQFDDILEASCTWSDVESNNNSSGYANVPWLPAQTKSPEVQNVAAVSLGITSSNVRSEEESTAVPHPQMGATSPNVRSEEESTLTTKNKDKSLSVDTSSKCIDSDAGDEVCNKSLKHTRTFPRHTVTHPRRNSKQRTIHSGIQLGSSEESISDILDSDDSYHPPIPGKNTGKDTDSESSDQSNAEEATEIHPQLKSKVNKPHNSTLKVLSEKTIAAQEVLRPELCLRWSGIKKQLDYALADARKLYVTHTEGHPNDYNLKMSQEMALVGKEMKQYADEMNNLATSLHNLIEKYDMDCFLTQEAHEEEVIKAMSANPKDNKISSNADHREEILSQLHQERYEENEIQRKSDAQVKGTVQVICTEKGSKIKVWKCNVCGESLSSRRMLDDHLQRHTGTILQCSKCPLKIKSRLRMKDHLEYHAHGPWVCEVCSKPGKQKQFIWKTSYRAHMRSHNLPNSLKCKVCGKIQPNLNDYRDHVKNKHTPGKHIQCSLCEKKCKTERALRAHLTLKHKKRDAKGQRI